MKEFIRKLMNKDVWAYGLFWSWNLIFLAFMTLGFAPRILPEMILAVGTSAIPISFLVSALVLTAIPVLTIILGLTVFRRAPSRLFALGYVVEGPLMLILAVRFFVIREATAALTVLLSIAGLGMGAFLWYLFDKNRRANYQFLRWFRLIGLTLMVLVSLYAAIWIGFYAVPLAGAAAQWLGNTLAHLPNFFYSLRYSLSGISLIWVPFTILGFILFLYTATLFVLTPIVVPALSLRAWWQDLTELSSPQAWIRPAFVVAMTIILCAAVFTVANRQPQQQAFTLLKSPPDSLEMARDLLAQQDTIRAGLLNAYLAPFRYLSADGEVVHIRTIYREVFGMTEVRAANVQHLYENVARPLLYKPVHEPQLPFRRDNVALQREPQEAAVLYQRFFDETIVEGERETVVNAVRATWSLEQAEAAWQAVDDREVLLVQQELNIVEHGDWAEVELLEIYQNQTSEQQEVVYYFNLPESAVLTGVWLGNSPDRTARFPFQVAPRGAAQAVYRNETRVFRDPALLEQIGPRQYRLRIFPILPIRTDWDADRAHTLVVEAPPLYMWLTYQALATEAGWSAPSLAYKRNVYWNGETIRLVNGSRSEATEEAWLPETLEASGPFEPVIHRVDFPNGESVLAVPEAQVELPALPANLQIAVVLDRSRSMARYTAEVVEAFERLAQRIAPKSSVEVFLTASLYRGEPPSRTNFSDFDPQEILYFGGQNAAELLDQFENLSAGETYDAILVFTDGSGYELGESQLDVPIPAAPIWMIHLGSDIPMGYDDDTLEAIQASGGGVVGDLDQALTRLAFSLVDRADFPETSLEIRDYLDGYLWITLPTDQAENVAGGIADEAGFAPLAARILILAEMRNQRETLGQVETLDHLHALAQEYAIVTPYSSMIVLVTAEQQRILDHLAQGSDRFAREFEDLTDTTPSTPTPLTGVPEPHEWLLIGLAVAMLFWYGSQKRVRLQNSYVGRKEI